MEEPEKDIQVEYEKDDDDEWVMLGHGAFGVVYAGFEATSRRPVAVKALLTKDPLDDEPLRQLRNEVRLMKQLDHPNIVSYLGTSMSKTQFFRLVMERVPGQSLSSLVRIGGAWGPVKTERQLSGFSKQILEGLAYLHQERVIHRDLKGANILVDTSEQSPVLKISDFGLSKQITSLTAAKTSMVSVGTIVFMAPEVMKTAPGGYKSSADIWSFGCVVVEMASGQRPYYQLKKHYDIVEAVATKKQPPDIPSYRSAECVGFISGCFRANPEMRDSAAALLRHPFISDS